MAVRIVELFGYSPDDHSRASKHERQELHCPFAEIPCTKKFHDGTISGVCTLRQATSGPIICCPNRLYADNYSVLVDIACEVFGVTELVRPDKIRVGKRQAVAFGKSWGRELQLPNRSGGAGAYFVDWILALIDKGGQLEEFVAVEVQSIDTTGNYRAEQAAHMQGQVFEKYSTAGMNWENVNKRILPQIIYKGHVLRREMLCKKGMFFICPSPVKDKIFERLGGSVSQIHPQPGALTFRWYDLGPEVSAGNKRELQLGGQFTTTIDQVALAFTSPTNLPPPNVYQKAILQVLPRSRPLPEE